MEALALVKFLITNAGRQSMSRNVSELDFRQWWCWAGDKCVMVLRVGRGLANCGWVGSEWQGRGRAITEAPRGGRLWPGGKAASRPEWLAAKWRRVVGDIAEVGGHHFP